MSEVIKDGKSSLEDVDLNLEFNRERWGRKENWFGKDNFGTRWGGGYQQNAGEVTEIADKFLWPYVGGYRLKVMELSPGAGRFTAELIRRAQQISLVDMNEACLEVCAERFKYVPCEQSFHKNDGQSLPKFEGRPFDLIACFDSMVHMHPDIARGYVQQMSTLISATGVIWLDHAGDGKRSSGHRTDVTAAKMKEWGAACGLEVISQNYRNFSGDCITVFRRT